RDDDADAASALAVVLGDDVGSRIFWELVDTGRADSASLCFSDFSDAGAFIANLCCNPEDAAENLATLRDILLDAQENGVEEEELVRAQNKLASRIVRSGERRQTRLFAVGSEWLATGKYRSVADDLAALRALTIDDLNAVMRKYPFDNPFFIAVGPNDSL
ncbi:MAG: insulinase family protein, partial [Thermoguttaceae bacterium]|nr:insulinase family protein [Thermoguttaceae bacterium]